MLLNTKFKETEIGLIPEDWEIFEIGDLFGIKGGKRLPKGESLLEKKNDHPYIRVTDMGCKTINEEKLLYLPIHVRGTLKRYTVNSNDIIISIVGTIGLVSKIQNSLDGANLTENCAKLCNINDRVDNEYIYYYLISENGQNEILKGTVGSTQLKLPLYNIKKIKIAVPHPHEQKNIAYILKVLDDKVDLNRQMNSTLEQIAQTLFKHWFIDFEFPDENGNPYKSSGGRMADSELREIPEGWKVKKLSDICTKVIDGTHDSPKPVEEGYYLVTGKHLSNGFIDFSQCYKISAEDHKKVISRSKPEKGDILFSNIGTLGSTVLVDQDFEFSIKNIALFKPLENFYSRYLYLHFSSTQTQKLLIQKATGTTQTFFSLKFLRDLELLVPPKDIVSKFDEFVQPVFEMRSLANQANQSLSDLRDSLLPKLMSGKIRVECLNGKSCFDILRE